MWIYRKGMNVYNVQWGGGGWTRRIWEVEEEGKRNKEMKRRWVPGLELGEEGDIKEG